VQKSLISVFGQKSLISIFCQKSLIKVVDKKLLIRNFDKKSVIRNICYGRFWYKTTFLTAVFSEKMHDGQFRSKMSEHHVFGHKILNRHFWSSKNF
jgi:hypothetical protein